MSTCNLGTSLFEAQIFFEEARKRVVAFAGSQLWSINPANSLQIDFTIDASSEHQSAVGLGLSADGRFAFGYQGFMPAGDGVNPGLTNAYLIHDLETRTSQSFPVPGTYFPFVNGHYFDRDSGTLITPAAGRVRKKTQKALKISLGRTRQVDIRRLTTEGSIIDRAVFVLPRSADDSTNAFLPFFPGIVAVSESRQVAFVPSTSASLFTFDLVTGELLNEEPVMSRRPVSIALAEQANLVVVSDADDGSVRLIDVSTGPVVSSVRVTSKETRVRGINFMSDCRVEIDGEPVDSVRRDERTPGRSLILNLGKSDFPLGKTVSIVVTNRDGLKSSAFDFTPQISMKSSAIANTSNAIVVLGA